MYVNVFKPLINSFSRCNFREQLKHYAVEFHIKYIRVLNNNMHFDMMSISMKYSYQIDIIYDY